MQSQLPDGSYYGNTGALNIEGGDARYAHNCLTGSLPAPIALKSDGTFEVEGTVQETPSGPSYPARYAGKIAGDQLALTMAFVDGAGRSQTFVDALQLGRSPGIVPLCTPGSDIALFGGHETPDPRLRDP